MPLHRVAEQDTTDLEKCLYSVEAPLFIGLGFLGGRIDHHLAAMNALVRYPGTPVVLVGDGELCFLCPELLELDLDAGTRVSLFPMGPVAGRDLQRAALAGHRAGASPRTAASAPRTQATGGPVRLGFDARRMLVMLPAGLLGAVVAALSERALTGPPRGLNRRTERNGFVLRPGLRRSLRGGAQ